MENVKEFIATEIEKIKKQINGKAIIALSGGVDSSVCAELAYRAIGDRLYPIFIDTGFMRKNEPEQVKAAFSHMNLQVIDASDRFFTAVKGITDPELKRKAIGETFIKVFEEEAKKIKADYLIQGTIYPDVLESEKGIKAHHNVGGMPEKMEFKGVVEPLYYLYKDDVREVGRELGLCVALSERMPFPGPGLSVRAIGEATREKVAAVREANAIVEEELMEKFKPWQAFAAVIGKGTGIKNDERIHGWIVAVRAVDSDNAMTAEPLNLPFETLIRIQQRITSEIPDVCRVVYDITSKPPGTIEFE
ncbi:glutamine-hydrolyzing GMP synthase [Methanolapillus millepedarum]|uniref:GMP synthase [glutamine-hydrolyzing] subunit B n=1 Tax=Methanolapillus millepedarum TaxID=3028296 RepID=A0AA96V322_9EURY|nr:GMP synthase [glutamine-hydrolyzing] [Methanosarcinaceae archaeon Ac7]